MKENVYLLRYFLFTILNFFFLLFIVGSHEASVLVLFMLCVVANQAFLYFGLADILEIHKNPLPIPSWSLFIFKFFLLILAFIVGLKFFPKYVLFLVLSYIFQLIILVLSTKRVVKKN